MILKKMIPNFQFISKKYYSMTLINVDDFEAK